MSTSNSDWQIPNQHRQFVDRFTKQDQQTHTIKT